MNSKKQSIQIFFENKAGDLAENCGVRFLDYELSKNYISLKILSSSSVLLQCFFLIKAFHRKLCFPSNITLKSPTKIISILHDFF